MNKISKVETWSERGSGNESSDTDSDSDNFIGPMRGNSFAAYPVYTIPSCTTSYHIIPYHTLIITHTHTIFKNTTCLHPQFLPNHYPKSHKKRQSETICNTH